MAPVVSGPSSGRVTPGLLLLSEFSTRNRSHRSRSRRPVVHSVPPGIPERAPGAGIEVHASDADELKRWQEFMASIELRHPESTERDVDLCPAATAGEPEPIRRRFPRFEAELQVRGYFGKVDELILMYTRDISKGGMFVRTDTVVDVGRSLLLQIVHPLTGLEFPLRCIVRRIMADGERGMGVEFQGMDGQRRNQLWKFISSGVPSVPADEADVTPPQMQAASGTCSAPSTIEPQSRMPLRSLPTSVAMNAGARPPACSAPAGVCKSPPLRTPAQPASAASRRGRFP